MLAKYVGIFKFLEPIGLRYAVTLTKKYPMKTPSILLAEHILPKLTPNDLVYEEVKPEVEESPCIKVLLTEDVPGLGSIGTVTSVHRNRFWRYLYIKGLAELPTEERIAEMKLKQKERSPILCGESYILQQHLMNMTLYIPMNPSREWTLSKTHVKVAFRKYGIIMNEDCISLPKQQITLKNATSPFKVSINKKLNNLCRCFSSATRRQPYEPIRIQQHEEGGDLTFSVSELSLHGKAALAHFDPYYTEAYGTVGWRSMRIALLMPPKKALLFNRYFPNVTLSSAIPSKFHSILPGTDFIRTLGKYQNSSLPEEDVVVHNDDDVDENPPTIHEVVSTMEKSAPRRQFLTRYNPSDDAMSATNLNEFIPSTELISENEMYTRECDTDFTYFTQGYSGMITGSQGDPFGLQSTLNVITEKIDLPTGLCIKCAPPGRLVSIPEPLYVNGQFSFHKMDLGSAVTVLALNLKKNDNMLNMSTFSGTKSVIALQTGLLNRLTCVVRSPSRTTHVQQITETFQLPENTTTEAEIRTKIDVICSNDLSNYLSPTKVDENFIFNKILVNVPCSADRYAITSDAVHVFSPGKINARTGLSKKQLNLLQHAMSLCPPNGDVVYSTSTLSPGQNQELIQSFIVNNSNIGNFALVNMKPLYNLLNSCYSKLGIKVIPIHLPLFDNRSISDKSKSSDICHALLIVPSISCNYGPTFIAKFRRLT